jgi:hypothetical protein
VNTGIKHPFSGALYQLNDDGTVSITEGDKQGLFHGDGRWISGTLRECDPQLCVWITNVPPAEAAPVSDSHLAASDTGASKGHPLA